MNGRELLSLAVLPSINNHRDHRRSWKYFIVFFSRTKRSLQDLLNHAVENIPFSSGVAAILLWFESSELNLYLEFRIYIFLIAFTCFWYDEWILNHIRYLIKTNCILLDFFIKNRNMSFECTIVKTSDMWGWNIFWLLTRRTKLNSSYERLVRVNLCTINTIKFKESSNA